jgi:predicted RNase H-like HicB family nuclease
MRQYIALIHKDAGSDYGVSFPDLPGCITAGVDLDDARRMAEDALALHLAGLAEDEEPLPEPSSLEAVMADRENRDAVAILVKAPLATTKAVRVNMTVPEDELEQIDNFAAEQGYTRSGFLVYAARKAIGEATARLRPEPRLTREEWRTYMMRRETANLTTETEQLDQETEANTAGVKDKLIDGTSAHIDANANDPFVELELLLRLTPDERLARRAELKAKVDALRKAIGGGG